MKYLRYLAHLLEGYNILDIGSGNGDLTFEIAEIGFNVTGIDINQALTEKSAKLAIQKNMVSKARFISMDANSLDFPDNFFDSVVIDEILEPVKNTGKILAEAVRVTRNGGRIVISVPHSLLTSSYGSPDVSFKEALDNALKPYAPDSIWHESPSNNRPLGSFFVKKTASLSPESPTIDVIMPTFNGKKFIRNAINSVFSQTYANWNLIIVNDGGESVEDIVKEFDDGRVKYFETEHKGKCAAVNYAVKNSSSPFISYLDDDDIIYPLHLEILIQAILKQSTDLAYSDCYEVFVNELNIEVNRNFGFRQDVEAWMLITQNYINHKNIMHTRSLFEKTGLYDEELVILEDWDMIRRQFFFCKPNHTWCVTSEHFIYMKNNVMSNRISGLWYIDPDICRQSIKKIVNKTLNLPASEYELKQSLVKSMQSFGYYHELELALITQSKDAQIRRLNSLLLKRRFCCSRAFLNGYRKLIEKLLPEGSAGRRFYELNLSAIRVIRYEGWRSLGRKIQTRLKHKPDY